MPYGVHTDVTSACGYKWTMEWHPSEHLRHRLYIRCCTWRHEIWTCGEGSISHERNDVYVTGMWFITYLTGDMKIHLRFFCSHRPTLLFLIASLVHSLCNMHGSYMLYFTMCATALFLRPPTPLLPLFSPRPPHTMSILHFWWSSIDGNIKNKQPCGSRCWMYAAFGSSCIKRNEMPVLNFQFHRIESNWIFSFFSWILCTKGTNMKYMGLHFHMFLLSSFLLFV